MKDIKDIFVNALSSFLLMLASTAYAANDAEAPLLECVSRNEAIHSFLQQQIATQRDEPQTDSQKKDIHHILDTSLKNDLLVQIQTAFLNCPEEIRYLIDNNNVQFIFPVRFKNTPKNEYVGIRRTYASTDLITEWLPDLWTAVMVTTNSTYSPGNIINNSQIDHNLPNNTKDPNYQNWEGSTLLNEILGSNNDRQGVTVYKAWLSLKDPPTYTWLPVTPKYYKMPGLYFHSSNTVNDTKFDAVRDFLISKNSPHLLSYTMQYAPVEAYIKGMLEMKIKKDFISRMHPILFHGDIRQVQKFIQELKTDIQQRCPDYNNTDKCKKWNHVNFYIVSPLDSNTKKPTYQHDTPSDAYNKPNNLQETTVNQVQILYGPIRVSD